MFGERIKQLRDEHMHTQEQLSIILGVSRSSVSNYESEERIPDIYIFGQIATLYNVSVDYIIGKSDIKNIDEYVVLKSFHKSYKGEISLVIDLVCLTDEVIRQHKNHKNFKLFIDIVKKLKDIFN